MFMLKLSLYNFGDGLAKYLQMLEISNVYQM